jgi:hypothetical protein
MIQQARKSTLTVLFCAALFSMCAVARASDADRIAQLVDIVKNGPSLYRTPEAAAAYTKYSPQGVIPAVSSADGLAAIKQSLRAAIELGDFGDKARDAVPTLIEVFPQAEYLSVTANAQFASGMGFFDDWVQTYVISAKNKFLLSSPFVEYQTLSRCEQFVEATGTTDIHQKRMVGSKIVEAGADIYVTIRINAAACALSKITGVEAGSTKEAWRMWYSRSAAPVASPAPSPAVQTKITVVNTPANPPSDYVTGARYQIALTTGDVMTGVIESSDNESFTLRLDGGGRYNYPKSFVKSLSLLSPPVYQSAPIQPQVALSTASPASIPYQDLLNFSYSGRSMEVVMANGTVMRGALGVVDANMLHITVDGTEMPISRTLIVRISLVTDPADTRSTDKPTQSAEPSSAPQPW